MLSHIIDKPTQSQVWDDVTGDTAAASNGRQNAAGKMLPGTGNLPGILRSAFQSRDFALTDKQAAEMAGRYDPMGKVSMTDFVLGTREAYEMGARGVRLVQAIESSAYSEKLTPEQFDRAWALGASAQSAETGSADAAAGKKAQLQKWYSTFKTGVNSSGVYAQKELIDLAYDGDPGWTGRRIYAKFSMDDTEFSQFYQQIARLSKKLPYYGEDGDPPAVDETFTVENGRGKKYLYDVELDGYMHGEILSKTDLQKYEKFKAKQNGGNKSGRSTGNSLRRVVCARKDLGRSGGDRRRRGGSGGSAGSDGMADLSQRGQQARDADGKTPADAQKDGDGRRVSAKSR